MSEMQTDQCQPEEGSTSAKREADQIEPWRERVQVEYDNLQGKIEKLGLFLDCVEAGTQEVDPVTKALLVAQHGAMTAYLGILYVRQTTTVKRG